MLAGSCKYAPSSIMQRPAYLDGLSTSPSFKDLSKAFHGSLACLPCSALASCPASCSFRAAVLRGLPCFGKFGGRGNLFAKNSLWFWKGCERLSYVQLARSSKETIELQLQSKQLLDELRGLKTKEISQNEDNVRVCGCPIANFSQRTYGSNQRDSVVRKLFLVRLAHSKIFEVLRSFLSPNWRSDVDTRGRLSVLSIFLSLLMFCPSLCLNGPPAIALEIAQKDALGKTFVMDSSRMEGWIRTGAVAGPIDLVQDRNFLSKATPLFSVSDNASVCEEAYGVFPCSNSLPGNLFLILVYGYLLLLAARFISEGSELLLEVMNPGLIGGLLLPILGALPDAALICASGIGGTVEEAQQEVLVGVGVLAGSTTLILTVAWAGSLVAGRCDLSGPEHTAKDLKLTRGFDLLGTGITTDEQTRWGALIMISSGAPYLFAQLPLLDRHPEQGPESALAGCVLALSGLVLYCSYQIASPWLQKKKIEEARLHFLRTSALQGITAFSANLMVPYSLSFQEQALAPSDSMLQDIFASFDKNADGKIEHNELRGLILGLNIDKGSFQDKEQVEKWFNEFDVNSDGLLSEAEFVIGIRNWANRVAEQRKTSKFQQIKNSMPRSAPDFWGAKLEEAKQALNLLEAELEEGEEFSSDKEGENSLVSTSKIYKKSAIYLVAGAALAAIFSDPLIDSIQGFSNSSSIPPFFVAFVVVPLASNASELFSSIVFASKKRKRNISLTYAQIYGAVTMNNTLCLGIFLGIVYARGLTWDFSSEVTVVLLTILCVGLIGASRVTFPLWYAIPVFSLYFLSLGGVALLDNLLGWH